MDLGHTDDDVKAVVRRRPLLAGEPTPLRAAEQYERSASGAAGGYRNGAQVLSSVAGSASPSDVARWAASRPMPTESDMLTP
jgi:hypothetical protein